MEGRVIVSHVLIVAVGRFIKSKIVEFFELLPPKNGYLIWGRNAACQSPGGIVQICFGA
jgi:hypothetical protein